MTTKDPILLRAYKGETTERAPIWLMRQAGRYLPEYRKLREANKLVHMMNNAELAAEVTLQPFKRFPLDGAIIFADLLTPLASLGVEYDFVEGEGPKVFSPVRTAQDVARLQSIPPEESVAPTLGALQIVRKEVEPKGVTLLGFLGAPFTLSAYLVEGGSSKQMLQVLRLMREDPTTWQALQDKLVDALAVYAEAQVKAGAQALQLFDSWAGSLSPDEYTRILKPHLVKLINAIRSRCSVPLIYFSTGTAGVLHCMNDLPVDAIGIDWRTSLPAARSLLNRKGLIIQGNLDPTIFAGDWSYCEKAAKRVLQEGKEIGPYIFNLGHGILPHTPFDNAARLVELVHKGVA